jgi:hypothetical protein
VIGRIDVEPPLDCPRGHLEHPAPNRRLDRLEVQTVGGARAYEPFDLSDDFRLEGFFEAPFWAPPFLEAASAASISASAHRSQASHVASTRRRNACPATACCRASSA